jgi:hypothetical protein
VRENRNLLETMVPRGGLPRVNQINALAKGGTLDLPTRSLCFPARVSHRERSYCDDVSA